MATALARGLVKGSFASADCIIASDVSAQARERFTDATGARSVESNTSFLNNADIVVLAVKPQQMGEVLADIQPHVQSRHLVVSIAAGVPLSTLSAGLGTDRRIVRVMPNTPCLVGASASAFALGGAATDEDGQLVEDMLLTVGIAERVPEILLDAVTGLSGSGPAYVYQVIEALSDGGVRAGLSREVATRLAAQTVMGASRMVLETGQHPGVLKDAVTSPGGTTIAGLYALEQGGMRGALMSAVEQATARSRELGESS